MAQAFNKVWHHGLLFKLKSFLPSYFYLLFKSYLKIDTLPYDLDLPFPKCLQFVVVFFKELSQHFCYLFNLFTSNQPTTLFIITGNFAEDKALQALHADPVTASTLSETTLISYQLGIKNGE